MAETNDNPSVKEVVRDALTQPLHAPFSRAGESSQGHKVNSTRIVEAVLIAAITALVSYIVTIPKLEQKIENQADQLKDIREELRAMRQDFYVPFSRGMSTPQKKDNNGG